MVNESGTMTSSTKSNGHWVAPGSAVELQEKVVSLATELYKSFLKNAGQIVSASNRRTVNFVHRYPLQATAGALIVGLFLGAAIRRTRA